MEIVSSNLKVKKSSKKNAGRWTKKQHQLFLRGLSQFGKDWKKIRELIPSRSLTQIRSHAQKYFIRIQTQKYNSEDEYSGLDADSQYTMNYQHFKQEHEKSPDVTQMHINHHENEILSTINYLKDKQIEAKKKNQIQQDNIFLRNNIKIQEQKVEGLDMIKKNQNQLQGFIPYQSNMSSNQTGSFFNQLLLNYYQYMINGQFMELVDLPNKQQ